MYKALQNSKLQPFRVVLGYLVPIIVYAGSFAFHTTLTRAGQLADQLPMIYGAIYLHHIISDDSFKTRLACFLVASRN